MHISGCPVLVKLPRECNQLAITFDDGPHVQNTQKILGLLHDYNAKATFFNTGSNLRNNRSLAEEVVNEGHVLANHTYTHGNALLTGAKRLHDELVRTRELIEDITGRQNRFFRPPYGIITPSLLSICRTLGLTIVLWNANTFDFRRKSPEAMVKRIDARIKPGTIILFHECHYSNGQLDYSNTIRALEIVLHMIHDKNIKAVSLDEAL